MPVTTLDATAGSADSNVYVTLTVADQYHEDRPANSNTDWSGASDPVKNAAEERVLLLSRRKVKRLLVV